MPVFGGAPLIPMLVLCALGVAFVLVMKRRHSTQLLSSFARAAEANGLTAWPDPQSKTWLAEAPPFLLLASGTNKQVRARATVPGGGELLIFTKGTQTSESRTLAYAIYLEAVESSTASFSLVFKDSLRRFRQDPNRTHAPLDGWHALAKRTLWMHSDSARAANEPIPQQVLIRASEQVEADVRGYVEFIGNVLIHYSPIRETLGAGPRGSFNSEDIAALIERGRDYAALLRR